MITLKKHNVTPYNELCQNLLRNHRCAYIAATGTGKTYVTSKYIEEHHNPKQVLILVPSKNIQKTWNKLLPDTTVMTYQSLCRGKYVPNDLKLIVCDEMHHLGAAKWGEAYEKITENFNSEIIGLSATPIRYLDNSRDMVEECFEGNCVKGLDLPEAINAGVLPPFNYFSALYNLPKEMDRITKDPVLTAKLTKQLDFDASKYAFEKILAENLRKTDRKVIVFVPSIAEIPHLMELIKSVFPEANHFSIHSKMPDEKVKYTTNLFENQKELSFLYSVDMIGEGTHIKGTTCVVMFRKTKSPTKYLQQLGRALAAENPDERALIFDFVANHINVDTYTKMQNSVIQWIKNRITDSSKQIIIKNYAIKELEILLHIKNILHNKWTDEEDNILKEYYPQYGAKKCAELLNYNHTEAAIMERARSLGVYRKCSVWTPEEDSIIKEYYPQYGTKKCAELLNFKRTECAITSRSYDLGITKDPVWTPEKDAIIKEHYPQGGAKKCEELFGYTHTKEAIKIRANILGITKNPVWTPEEDSIIKEYYPQYGTKKCAELFGYAHTKKAIRRRAHYLGLIKNSKWTPKQDAIVITHFHQDGIKKCAELLNYEHPEESIKTRAKQLGITKKSTWTPEKDAIIKEHYPQGGAKKCEELLNYEYNKYAIIGRANRLGITKNPLWTPKKDAIIKKYYPQGGAKKCAELLNYEHCESTITSRAWHLGVRKIK